MGFGDFRPFAADDTFLGTTGIAAGWCHCFLKCTVSVDDGLKNTDTDTTDCLYSHELCLGESNDSGGLEEVPQGGSWSSPYSGLLHWIFAGASNLDGLQKQETYP